MNTKIRREFFNLFINHSHFKRSFSLSIRVLSSHNLTFPVPRQFLLLKQDFPNFSNHLSRQISTTSWNLNDVRKKMESQGDFRKPLEDWDEEFRKKAYHKAMAGYLYNRISISQFPKDEELIYQGPLQLKHQMRAVKVFSFGSSVLGFMFQYKILNYLEGNSMMLNCAALTFIGFFTYVTPFLIHSLTKRFVNEVFYNPVTNTYTAVTYTFFLGRNEIKFKLENVEVPDVAGMFTTIVVKKDGKTFPMLINDQSFHEYTHYGKLMGYDKPLDFMLSKSIQEDDPNPEKSSKPST